MKSPLVDTASLSAAIRARQQAAVPVTGAGGVADPARAVRTEGDSSRVQNAVGASSVDRAFRQGLEAARSLDALSDLDARLDELSALVKERATGGAGDDAQSKIDAMVRSINDAAESAGSVLRSAGGSLNYSRTSGTPSLPDGAVSFTNVSPLLEQFRAVAPPALSASLDINVEITASAQQAGFFLSLGASQLDLSAATALFVLELTGSRGQQSLSFASGTTIQSIAAAINAFADATGIAARVSGTGIALNSEGFGDDRFVSVRAWDGAHSVHYATSGLYNLKADSANAANPDSYLPLGNLGNLLDLTDYGQDVRGRVNGVEFRGSGRQVSAFAAEGTDDPFAQFALTPDAAQVLGSFRAFTMHLNTPLLRSEATEQEVAHARGHVAALREGLARVRDEQRAAAGALPTQRIGAPNQPIDPVRVRELLMSRSNPR